MFLPLLKSRIGGTLLTIVRHDLNVAQKALHLAEQQEFTYAHFRSHQPHSAAICAG